MKYAVISPDNKLICFDHSDQVRAYCMEKDNGYLKDYCEDQGYVFETMTPVEIGYAYTEIGADHGGCRIFETTDMINTMREEGADEDMIEEVNGFFNNRRLNREIDCPSYLEDILPSITPIPVSTMTDGVYISNNVDGASDERNNSGV